MRSMNEDQLAAALPGSVDDVADYIRRDTGVWMPQSAKGVYGIDTASMTDRVIKPSMPVMSSVRAKLTWVSR